MLKAIIVEDEKEVMSQLIVTLKEVEPDIEITATISSVEEGIQYLSAQPHADIIFSDVQLCDGISFQIFLETRPAIPVVFITGYDQFMLNAFEYNGIDYLLKPIDKADLVKAIAKFKMLRQHFTKSGMMAIDRLTNSFAARPRSRMVVRRGIENISLRLADIVLFYTENKVVYVTDKCGRKFICDHNLSDLEAELDSNMFFRANRQYIVNIDYIRSYKAFEKVKLQIDLSVECINLPIIISQETASLFRKWIAGNYV